MNLQSIIVLIIVLIVIGLSFYKLIKNKKDGKCSCGCETCINKNFCTKNK